MARWSSPSAGQGVNRFRVWDQPTDNFQHGNPGLQANWDSLDGIIGIPSGGNWPPTTGVDGGIYREVKILQDERWPIGSFLWWWRPTNAVPLPTNLGWAVCDGSTLAPSQHSFPGIATSITLPDLRNAFVLGADPTKAWGTAAAAVGSGNENAVAGAPGTGATGGTNSVQLTVNQMANHNHGGVTGSVGFNNQAAQAYTGQGNFANDMWGAGPNALDGEQGNHTHTIPSQGGGAAHENRPSWVAFIPLLKVTYVTTP